MRYIWIVLLIVLFLPECVEAQSFYAIRRERTLMATAGIGSSTYYGDLRDPGDFIKAKPAISLGLKRYFFEKNEILRRISFRSEINWFLLKGEDSNSEEDGKVNRNLSFTSGVFELNATAHIDLFRRGIRFYQRPKINPYGFIGIAGIYFNPKAELNGKKHALQPLKTEGVSYNRITFSIPYGFGVNYMIDPFINVSLEMGYRLTFSDYLDDVSTEYIDNNSFTDPVAKALADRRPEIGLPVRPEGSKRGDPSNNDGYLLVSIKVEYYLPHDFLFNKDGQRKLFNRKRKAYYR
jgi:hypothetical protein